MSEEKNRPKKSETITVWVKQDVIKLVDDIAKKSGNSKNKIISNIIGAGLEEIKDQNKYGIVKMNFLVSDFKDKVMKWNENKKLTESKQGDSITIRLDQEVVNELEEWAKRLGLTRSKLVQSLFDIVSNDLRILNRIGMVNLVLMTEKIKEIWRKQLKETEKLLNKGVLKLRE